MTTAPNAAGPIRFQTVNPAALDRAIQVTDLVKRYPKSSVNALDGLSFTVAPGEVFGLLGPNGAGKTTTVGILTTRVRPTSGMASVCGIDVIRHPLLARNQFAVVPQRNNLDRSLSIRDSLIFHAAYHSVPSRQRAARADDLLAQFGLLERAHSKPDAFSGGQAQRVMIARALMHMPKVLFLDEPTTGLDPAARLFVWDRLRELVANGVTMVLTTHDMDEAATLASRVGIMDRGRLLALDSPAALICSLRGRSTLELTAHLTGGSQDALLEALSSVPETERVEQVSSAAQAVGGHGSPGEVRLRLHVAGDAPRWVAPAASLIAKYGGTLTGVTFRAPTLEDVFIHLTGGTLR